MIRTTTPINETHIRDLLVFSVWWLSDDPTDDYIKLLGKDLEKVKYKDAAEVYFLAFSLRHQHPSGSGIAHPLGATLIGELDWELMTYGTP